MIKTAGGIFNLLNVYLKNQRTFRSNIQLYSVNDILKFIYHSQKN